MYFNQDFGRKPHMAFNWEIKLTFDSTSTDNGLSVDVLLNVDVIE